jgi:predicted RNA-binding protein with PIN domain
MPYLIDGHNLLGALRLARESVEAQRALMRRLGALARTSRAKVYCVFDGETPAQLGRSPGGVVIEFSGGRTADELIAARCATGSSWKVVTADRALGQRIRRRGVEILDPREFASMLEQLPEGEVAEESGEWADYFSDPRNRNI